MALVAVWLTVLAPTVSRTAAAAFVFPELGAWCEAAPGSHHGDPGGHVDDGDAACGYCTLFAHTPALGSSFFIGHVLPLPGPDGARVNVAGARAPVAVHHASPRGPPVVAHA
jgi:hypothetical protein